jgi:hypothetical protein
LYDRVASWCWMYKLELVFQVSEPSSDAQVSAPAMST